MELSNLLYTILVRTDETLADVTGSRCWALLSALELVCSL